MIDSDINLSKITGRTILYIYPRTGLPSKGVPEGWDAMPGKSHLSSFTAEYYEMELSPSKVFNFCHEGARGCTPQSCAFRDHYKG
jgi:peroxiredoxin